MRGPDRRASAWSALLALVLASAATSAAADGRVEIGRIRGPGGHVVARSLGEALAERGVEVTEGAEVLITGLVRRTGPRRHRRHVLDLAVRRGEQVERVRVVRRSAAALASVAADELVPLLAVAPAEAPAATPRPTRVEAQAPARARPAARASSPPARFAARHGETALELFAGFDWLARHLSFNDDLFDRIGTYRLDAAPAAVAGIRWYPARHWTSHVLAGIGVEAEARGAFGVSSITADGQSRYATTIDDWRVGGLFHARVLEPLQLLAGVGYGEARFRIEPAVPASPGSPPEPLPSVRYRYLRTSGGLEVDLASWLSFGGSVGWRAVISSGQLAYPEWFPRSFTTGVDLGLTVTLRVERWLAFRARVNHIRYISALNPEPGDIRVAGGALDEWTHAGVDLVAFIPGAP